eukprot:COSAG06_NODE_61892_length_262_cov_0.934132_1_plen_46_part_01
MQDFKRLGGFRRVFGASFARFRRHQMRAPLQILGAPNTQANLRTEA